MRNKITAPELILIAILALVLNSCCCHRLPKEFSEIETIVSEHPDSALAMIDSIDTLSLKSVRSKAEYALLRAKCLDKNHIDDGIFLKQLKKYDSYFIRRASVEKRMLYGYYLADLYYDAGEYEEASIWFLETLDYATEIEDWFYAGQSSWSLAVIYLKTFNYAEELKYIGQAYDCLLKGGFDYYADYAEVELAEAWLKKRFG